MIRTASRSASLFLGLDEDRPLTGETIESVVPAELARRLRTLRSNMTRTIPPPHQPQELRYTDPEGALRILEYVVTPSRLAAG